ncbi:MAG: hypothetical protein ABR878_18460 [Roseiarcus sp.]
MLFVGLALLFGGFLQWTRYGRTFYPIGNNPFAARFSGRHVDRTRFLLFTFTGFLSGLAAVLLTARIGSTRSNIATGWELTVLTMVFLGGILFAGGAGTIPSVVLAIFVLGTVTWGLSLVNVPAFEISVLLGALLITTIAAPIVIGGLMGRDVRGERS